VDFNVLKMFHYRFAIIIGRCVKEMSVPFARRGTQKLL